MGQISIAENGNVYDLRGLASDKANVDTSKIGVGTTYFKVDGQHNAYAWTGTSWSQI